MNDSPAVKAFAHIAKLQDALNAQVNPSWRHANYEWYRALWTEVGEAMAYVNWPWWKARGPRTISTKEDRYHLYLELADCLHFDLSMALQAQTRDVDLSNAEEVEKGHRLVGVLMAHRAEKAEGEWARGGDKSLPAILESVALDALRLRAATSSHLFLAALVAGMGVHGLLIYYHGKNLLNGFRQEHGYKTGNYRKNWGTEKEPMEDNLALAELIEEYRAVYGESDLMARINNGSFASYVRQNLTARYNQLLADEA